MNDVARILDAASFAAFKHRKQRRKDVDATPYINHPLDVARILAEAGVDDVEVLMAAILHDTIEDTKTTAEELTARFGERVCGMVLEVTDNKNLDKLERKRLQVIKAPTKSDDAKQIKIADKLANLRDFKSPPVGWSEARIGAYIQFAEMVARGCAGANEVLDRLIRECLDGFSIAAELSETSPKVPPLKPSVKAGTSFFDHEAADLRAMAKLKRLKAQGLTGKALRDAMHKP